MATADDREDRDAHDQRIVVRHDGLQGQPAHARVAENNLHDERAVENQSQAASASPVICGSKAFRIT